MAWSPPSDAQVQRLLRKAEESASRSAENSDSLEQVARAKRWLGDPDAQKLLARAADLKNIYGSGTPASAWDLVARANLRRLSGDFERSATDVAAVLHVLPAAADIGDDDQAAQLLAYCYFLSRRDSECAAIGQVLERLVRDPLNGARILTRAATARLEANPDLAEAAVRDAEKSIQASRSAVTATFAITPFDVLELVSQVRDELSHSTPPLRPAAEPARFVARPGPSWRPPSGVRDVVLLRDLLVVAGSDGSTVGAVATSGNEVWRHADPALEAPWLRASADGRTVCAIGSARAAVLDTVTGRPHCHIALPAGLPGGFHDVAVSPAGELVATSPALRVWSAHSGEVLTERVDAGGVLAWIGEGLLAVGGDGIEIMAVVRRRFGGKPTLRRERTLTAAGGGSVVALAPLPNSAALLVAGTDEGTVQLWDVHTSGVLWEDGAGAESINVLAADSGPDLVVAGTIDGGVTAWSAATGEAVLPTTRLHDGAINTIAISPSGAFVATTGDDDRVLVTHMRTGAVVLELASSGLAVSAAWLSDAELMTADETSISRWELPNDA